jgi:hypothetical protein
MQYVLKKNNRICILPQTNQRGIAMNRVPSTAYLWISRFGGFVAIVCIIIAVVTDATNSVLGALPKTYIQIAIAAFLFAIWAVLYELRDQGIKTK